MPNRFEVCIDVADPDVVRPFWLVALGYLPTVVENGATILTDPTGVGPTIWFQRVPEPKVVKNRVHLDIWLDSEAEATELAAELMSLGGATLPGFGDEMVLADPEGNEVCLNWPV